MRIRTYAAQKSGLTRALKSGHAAVVAECERVLAEWGSPEWRTAHGTNAWPDDWARWERALSDAYFDARYRGESPADITSLDDVAGGPY